MAKYCGVVGYAITTETEPGIWTETITERKYFGDILRMNRRLSSSDKINDDVDISNEISILSDAFALQHFGLIRYATWFGQKWKVNSVEVEYPRIKLSLGGLWNG